MESVALGWTKDGNALVIAKSGVCPGSRPRLLEVSPDGTVLGRRSLSVLEANLLQRSTQPRSMATVRAQAGSGRSCPEPLPLGPRARAKAKRAALAREAALPKSRWRGKSIDPDPRVRQVVPGMRYEGQGGSPAVHCGVTVARRTLVVRVLRRGYARLPLRSASLSQGVDFVARFPDGYRVWLVAH